MESSGDICWGGVLTWTAPDEAAATCSGVMPHFVYCQWASAGLAASTTPINATSNLNTLTPPYNRSGATVRFRGHLQPREAMYGAAYHSVQGSIDFGFRRHLLSNL